MLTSGRIGTTSCRSGMIRQSWHLAKWERRVFVYVCWRAYCLAEICGTSWFESFIPWMFQVKLRVTAVRIKYTDTRFSPALKEFGKKLSPKISKAKAALFCFELMGRKKFFRAKSFPKFWEKLLDSTGVLPTRHLIVASLQQQVSSRKMPLLLINKLFVF